MKLFLPSRSPKVLIVGAASIAGAAIANQLLAYGNKFAVDLIDPRSNASRKNAAAMLPSHTVAALHQMGFAKLVKHHGHCVDAIHCVAQDGQLHSRASLSDEPSNRDYFVGIHESALHDALVKPLQSEIRYGVNLHALHRRGERVNVRFSEDDHCGQEYDLVIGADGACSTVRQLVYPGFPLLDDLGITRLSWLSHTVIPKVDGLTFMVRPNAAMMFYPLGDGQGCWSAYIVDEEYQYTDPQSARKKLQAIFNDHRGVMPGVLTSLPKDGDITVERVRTLPYSTHAYSPEDNVVLLGDAAETCSPVLQQGVATGLDGANALAFFMDHFPLNHAIRAFELFRTQYADSVMSCSNHLMDALVTIHDDPKSISSAIQDWRKVCTYDPREALPMFTSQYQAQRMMTWRKFTI